VNQLNRQKASESRHVAIPPEAVVSAAHRTACVKQLLQDLKRVCMRRDYSEPVEPSPLRWSVQAELFVDGGLSQVSPGNEDEARWTSAVRRPGLSTSMTSPMSQLLVRTVAGPPVLRPHQALPLVNDRSRSDTVRARLDHITVLYRHSPSQARCERVGSSS